MPPTPAEDLIGEITWTWLCIGTFLKGFVFMLLARWIFMVHRDAGITPSPLASALMWLFLAIGAFSFSLTAILFVVLLNDYESIKYLAPFWVRVTVRVAASATLVIAVITGILVVRTLDRSRSAFGMDRPDRVADAAERTAAATERMADTANEVAANGFAAERTANATERLADTAAAVMSLGDAGRMADATDRIADSGERIMPPNGENGKLGI